MDLQRHLEAAVVMRRNPEQKKESSLSVIQLRHGIRKTRDRRCGSFITLRSRRERVCEYSQFPTGQKRISGSTFSVKNIEIVPLYFAKERLVIYRDGNIIMVDDDRLKLRPGEKIENKKVRSVLLDAIRLLEVLNLKQILWMRLLMRR